VQETLKTSQLSADEIGRLGQAIYDRDLKDKLEPSRNGEYVAIHIVNGDYFVAAHKMDALDAARARYPGEVFFLDRIGFPASLRLRTTRHRHER
jgi:hypothetical protein